MRVGKTVFYITISMGFAIFGMSSFGQVFNSGDIDTHPVIDDSVKFESWAPARFPSAPYYTIPATNDLVGVFKLQAKVKDQGKRGTCTIFSTLESLEILLKLEHQDEEDLSEQYLQYLVMTQLQIAKVDGSSVQKNIQALKKWGIITEAEWEYNPDPWKDHRTCSWIDDESDKLACNLGQMNPYRNAFYDEGQSSITDFFLDKLNYRIVTSATEIKSLLIAQRSLVLDLKVFFGAWNHPMKETLGIGKMDSDLFKQGTIQVPTQADIDLSSKSPSNHSLLVIGYDDLSRVYYFKNSWGTHYWGKNAQLPGVGDAPGYGTIPYDYANKYGTFTTLEFTHGEPSI